MAALFILLFVLGISIFINRLATKALTLTGLSKDVAAFQARSVTTGTGFTTEEAESLVQHPARRRIVMLLMIIQNAGLVTVISTFILSFVNTGSSGIALQRIAILVSGVALLIFLSRNKWVDRQVEKIIDWLLDEYTQLKVIDYHNLLNLHKDYTISRFTVEEDSWLTGNELQELDLPSEGIMILCIEYTDGSVTCATKGDDKLSAGDKISVYGKESSLKELQKRYNDGEGGEAHEKAVERHQREKDR